MILAASVSGANISPDVKALGLTFWLGDKADYVDKVLLLRRASL